MSFPKRTVQHIIDKLSANNCNRQDFFDFGYFYVEFYIAIIEKVIYNYNNFILYNLKHNKMNQQIEDIKYNPVTILQILSSKKQKSPLDIHYIMQTMKKGLDVVRQIYDYQSGQDMIQLIQLRHGFLSDKQQAQKYEGEEICFYKPKQKQLPRKIKHDQVELENLANRLTPILAYQQIFWVFIIDGELKYKQNKYKSGDYIIIEPQFQHTLKQSNSLLKRQFSIIAIINRQRRKDLTKLKFLRDRNKHVQFFRNTIFKTLSKKQLYLLHNQLSIIHLRKNQNIQFIQQYEQQFRIREQKGCYNLIENQTLLRSNKSLNKSSASFFHSKQNQFVYILYSGQISVKSQFHSRDDKFQLCTLTSGCIFYNNQVYQRLKLNKMFVQQIQTIQSQYDADSKIEQIRQNYKKNNAPFISEIQKYNDLNINMRKITGIEKCSNQLSYICHTQQAIVFAIPVQYFQKQSKNQLTTIRNRVIQLYEERQQRSTSLISLKKNRTKQLLRTVSTWRQKIKHNNHKFINDFQIPKKLRNIKNKYFTPPPKPITQRRHLQNKSQNQSKSFYNLQKKQNSTDTMAITSIKSTTEINPEQKIKKGYQFSEKMYKTQCVTPTMQKQQQKLLNAPFNNFFVAKSFVSKKLQLQYRSVLDFMKRKQNQLTPEKINRTKYNFNPKQYINQKRIIKLQPKKKYLPIYYNEDRVKQVGKQKFMKNKNKKVTNSSVKNKFETL